MVRELQRDVALDRRFVQVGRRDFAAEAPRHEVELQREERMSRLRQLRRADRGDDQQSRVVQPPGQVADEIGRRRIGPVQIVEPQHDWLHPPGLFEERGDFPLEPLLRAAGRLGGQPGRRRIVF